MVPCGERLGLRAPWQKLFLGPQGSKVPPPRPPLGPWIMFSLLCKCQKWFIHRSHTISHWSMIAGVSVVLRRTVCDDIDWCFDNLSGSLSDGWAKQTLQTWSIGAWFNRVSMYWFVSLWTLSLHCAALASVVVTFSFISWSNCMETKVSSKNEVPAVKVTEPVIFLNCWQCTWGKYLCDTLTVYLSHSLWQV